MAAMSTYYLIQRHLLRHAKPKSPVCLLLRSSSVSVLTRKSNHPRRFPSFFFSSISSSLPLKCPYVSLPSLLVPKYLSTSVVESKQDEDKQDKDNMSLASLSKKNDEESYSKEEEEEEDGSDCTIVSMRENGRSCDISEEMMTESSALKLSVKEKKKLASYAHSLGDKLKCQLVGKSGVTDSVVFSFLETLEKNELLKVKIHRTCPGEVEDMILRLEEATGSVAVGKIARTVILYRPSPTKLIEKRR